MEKHQDFAAAQPTAAQHAEDLHWEVTYLDTDCGRVRTETFDDATSAERFARRRLLDEDGWAIVDAVHPRQARAAA
jgi:hypothetical protein